MSSLEETLVETPQTDYTARTNVKAKLGKRVMKYVDAAVCYGAGVAFDTVQYFNRFNPNPAFTPKWTEKPLLKSWQKTKPVLGWPRQTDSLCPICVKEAREAITSGQADWTKLLHEKVGEVKANIIERDGQVWMVKDCPQHGKTEDLMAIDVKFLEWIEKNFPGRDIPSHNDKDLHNHGSSTIKHGRGAVLTVDLTNRCNMMCDPCFMDANQVGYVHELTWPEIMEIMDNAHRRSSRDGRCRSSSQAASRRMSPLLHRRRCLCPKDRIFQRAGGNQRNRVRQEQGILQRRPPKPDLRYAYLQFDGIGNDANSHRQIGNLFDVKLRAINNLHEAGVEIILVVTLVNGVNNDQVGSIIRFAMDNPEEDCFHRIPARVIHRPRRRHHAGTPASPALHAVASRQRREEPGRHHRTDSRLVPAFHDGRVCRLCRSRPRTRRRLGPGQLRLPSELRRRHGA